MSITCKFQLSRISNIYYSGEDIAGTITICSAKQRQIEAFILEFYGQSTVQWWELDKTEENVIHNDFSTQEISNKTLCKRQQKHVCEQLKMDTSSQHHLEAHVEYTFNFCFAIPKQVPATCRCSYGQTEYGLKFQIKHAKKVNKEFHQRIVVKNKLDLTQELKYTEPKAVSQCNEFGQIILQVPCTGFTPGQTIPFRFKYDATQSDCKLLIQLNCLTSCYTQTVKQIKKTVNYTKHLMREASGHINVPLHSRITSIKESELIVTTEYILEAILINGQKKPLISTFIPITIGTTPCYRFDEVPEVCQGYMCYDNYGSSSLELSKHNKDGNTLNFSQSVADQLYESLWMLPIKRQTHLRKSLRYCYKKLIKLI